MENENWYLPWLFLSILIGIALIVLVIVGLALLNRKKRDQYEKQEHYLEYSDKVKNYQGKNVETDQRKLASKYYDENGKRKMICDDSERYFTGEQNYLMEPDKQYLQEFVEFIFPGDCFGEHFIRDKVNRLYNSKENNGGTLLDIRYFFKNPSNIILPFHLTEDKRSNMILYYCQTRAIQCVKMPKTRYSSESEANYLAYFPLDAFDDMCFVAYLMVKYPMGKGMSIHGFESGLQNQNLSKNSHDKDYVYEYIYRMLIDDKCRFFPMENALVETEARVLKAPGYPDASEYSSKQAEIKAEMQREGLVKSGLHNENERKLFFLVKESYPDAIYQYRDEWLGYYSLDIYIPSLKIAIEYQGGQHYESVKLYGGDKALKGIQERDASKEELCRRQGVKLVEWKYDVPIIKANLETLIKCE